MTDRIIAIGDIHGCSKALATLMEAFQPTHSDTLVFLGDYFDPGPDSRVVVEPVVWPANEAAELRSEGRTDADSRRRKGHPAPLSDKSEGSWRGLARFLLVYRGKRRTGGENLENDGLWLAKCGDSRAPKNKSL